MLRFTKGPGILLAFGLLLFVGAIWWGESRGQPQTGLPLQAIGESLMTGVRYSSWEETRRTCSLEMQRLELTPKAWGLFKLADSKDVRLLGCKLRVDQANLAVTLQEIAQTLVYLAGTNGPGSPEAAGNIPLLVLPPKISALPFSCLIDFSQGKWLIVQADLATIVSAQPVLQLHGSIKVISADGVCLQAEDAVWQLLEQRLRVEGLYTWKSGKRQSPGRDRGFSLAGGNVARDRTASAGLLPSGSQEVNPFGALLTQAISQKNFSGAQTFLVLPYLAAAQAGGAKAASDDPAKEWLLRNQRFSVYPPPPNVRSPEETVVREVLCEKSDCYTNKSHDPKILPAMPPMALTGQKLQ